MKKSLVLFQSDGKMIRKNQKIMILCIPKDHKNHAFNLIPGKQDHVYDSLTFEISGSRCFGVFNGKEVEKRSFLFNNTNDFSEPPSKQELVGSTIINRENNEDYDIKEITSQASLTSFKNGYKNVLSGKL